MLTLYRRNLQNNSYLCSGIMEKKHILVVDDEPDLCDILLFNLHGAGYEAEAVGSAEEALHIVGQRQSEGLCPDLLLLDVMMPGMSGFELATLLKANRQTANVPIIFLTAKDTEDDTLHGFRLGADDYVSKPFSIRELMARVKAVLGRTSADKRESSTPRDSGLKVEEAKGQAYVDGQAIPLTRTEFDLLRLFMQREGQILTRQDILESAWPRDVIVTDRTVDVHIARLRKKLGRFAGCILCRQGFGYIFDPQQALDR